MTPKSQTTSVAITQVEKPAICSPLVSQVVTRSPTKVVTSAIPPVSARTYLNDSLKISGARMNRAAVKTRMTVKNPVGVMTKPGSSHLATRSPMALATSSTTVTAIRRSMRAPSVCAETCTRERSLTSARRRRQQAAK